MEQPPSFQLEKQGAWHNVAQRGCGLRIPGSAQGRLDESLTSLDLWKVS